MGSVLWVCVGGRLVSIIYYKHLLVFTFLIASFKYVIPYNRFVLKVSGHWNIESTLSPYCKLLNWNVLGQGPRASAF